jgi:flagellar basal-body rod protein FlgB
MCGVSPGGFMPISDTPILSMLRTRMHWHQERQRVLAENVANADTPKFKPRDLAQPDFGRTSPSAARSQVVLAQTNAAHLQGASGGFSNRFEPDRKNPYEVRPAGNAVNLEDQMMKVAANQMDYQTVSSLYTRSLGLIKTALGKR